MWLALGYLMNSIVGKALIVIAIILAIFLFIHVRSDAEAKKIVEAYVSQLKDKDAKINELQLKLNDATTVQYVKKIDDVKKQGDRNREIAKRVPDRANLSNGWVQLHDTSASGKDANASSVVDATPSGVESNQALGVVTENYAICRENAEQLISLQNWIVETEKNVNQK
jgi:hypothetical protein